MTATIWHVAAEWIGHVGYGASSEHVHGGLGIDG